MVTNTVTFAHSINLRNYVTVTLIYLSLACHWSIQIVIHYGISKPQSKVMYVLSISSEPSRNVSGPLKVYFSGNTPLVNGFTITVQVFTSKPATAICHLGKTTTMLCELLLSQHQCVKCYLGTLFQLCAIS